MGLGGEDPRLMRVFPDVKQPETQVQHCVIGLSP